jgi:Cof subfamily protein (haloacid dehalogenase superfamily)
MIRLIAFDLDGTMLDENSVMSGSTIESLQLLIDRGYTIASISGRSVRRSLEPLADHADIAARMYVCAYNGAVIVGPEVDGRRKKLYEQRLADEVFKELMEYVRDRDLNIVYCRCENSASGLVEEYRFVRTTEEISASWTGAGFVTDARLVERILQGEFNAAPKIMVMTGEEKRDKTVTDLQDRFGDALYLTWPLVDRIEVMHPAVNKGIALQALARLAEVPLGQIMALGDGHNDLPMLRQAGVGILMGNAFPAIRAAVEGSGIRLGPTLQEEGFTQMVQDYVFGA